MSGTNKIVTSTVNVVSWEISRSSYEAAKKKILSLQQLTAKPVKALEQAQKRTAQSEGKAALAAAKAQTQRLKMAQKLSLEQQRQAQAQAKIAKQEEAHARKMQALNARGQAKQLSQQEQAARQSARLAAISEKVRAAARSGAATYNPDAPSIGREHYNPAVAARQNAQMMRGHGAVAADIAATKKAMALEEKRQREKEASLKRQSTAYDTLRRASLTISHIEGASLADKMKAVQAIKEATKGYSEQRYTIAEMRHELAKATLETRRQARINRQIIKDKAKVERAGRINAQRLTRERSERGYAGLAAAGVIGGAALVGSMGVSRVGQTLQGSLERSRDVKKLQQYGISNLEFAALQDLSMSRVGYSLSADKLADLNKDTTEKAGELLNAGSFKRNKKTGQVNFSGGGEFADIINNVLTSTNGNQKVAQKVIGELQKLDFPTFITYLKQLQKTFKWTDNQTRHLAEAVNDGSVFLDVFNDEGKGLIDRMKKLSSEGWALSDSQQANLDKLSALSTEYSRVQTSLADHFSASFVAGLGEYGQNTDNLSKGMAGLIPITNELGKSFGEMASAILKITSWFGSINPENKHEQLSENGLYYKDSMVGRVWQSFKNAIEGVTSASTIPGVQGLPSQSYGSGTAFNNPALALNVPGLNYQTLQPQQPTFTVPTIDSLAKQQPIPVSVTGQANINQQMDVFVHDDKIAGLVDTKIRENNQAQNNLILGIAQ